MGIIIAVLLVLTSKAEARFFDKWGFRVGSGQAIGDNISGNIRESDVRSGLFGLSGAFELEPDYNLWIEFRGELRYTTWRIFDIDFPGRTYTYEFAPGVSFLYSLPVPIKPKFSLSYRIGIEHNYHSPFSDMLVNDVGTWQRSSWSWVVGGEIVVPMGVPELVFSIRYNEDMTDNVEHFPQFTPEGSRFSEVHYMVGMNFDLRK
ncbi:hypothetical protein EH220_02250 [bacterium]|nr:MAG: hypothetical protein EH220_02250 [bacterium]